MFKGRLGTLGTRRGIQRAAEDTMFFADEVVTRGIHKCESRGVVALHLDISTGSFEQP